APLGFRSVRGGHPSAPSLPRHRTCLSTEPGSVLLRVKIASQRGNVILELARLWEGARRNRPKLARSTDANSRIHCLFTVIHCCFWRGKIANFPNHRRGRRLRGIVRCSPPLLETIRC